MAGAWVSMDYKTMGGKPNTPEGCFNNFLTKSTNGYDMIFENGSDGKCKAPMSQCLFSFTQPRCWYHRP